MDEGYHKIAWRMASVSDLAIFRRFQALNLQNILYLQAELSHLEAQLEQQATADAQSASATRKLHSRDWFTLENSHTATDGDGRQWEIFLKIRSKLKEYNEALVHEALLSRLGSPRPHHVRMLKECLEDPKLSDYLLGRDSNIWSDEKVLPDLISAHPVHDFDPLSLGIIKLFLPIFHKLIGRHFKDSTGGSVYHYDDEHLEFPASVISSVLASMLPVLSIVFLYLVNSMSVRLGMIVAFTAIFSFILALITKGRRIEVFAATAAFAAVQVVFVSTNVDGNEKNS